MPSSYSYTSPLRYPGGKSRITPFVEDILLHNDLKGCTFYELYAGGAGVSLNLLLSNTCNKIVLNDLDFHIYAFWVCILNHTEEFIKRISDAVINIDNWHVQNKVYENYEEHDILDVGFSTFFLNRSNRSGIVYKAGPIGGQDQTGKYKIDARFNKPNLIKRIEKIARLRDRIEIRNCESRELLNTAFSDNSSRKFMFLDPPYYVQGERLYLNAYEDSDHVALRDILRDNKDAHWLLTYDNSPRIHELYQNFRKSYLVVSYTLQEKRKAKEVMIFSDSLHLPELLKVGAKTSELSLTE